MEVDSQGEVVVVDVEDVSAIALANGEVEQPGFPGATLLGQLQAFARDKGIEPKIGYEIPAQVGYRIKH